MRAWMRWGMAAACAVGLLGMDEASAADAVVDEVIALAQENALNGQEPDWERVRAEANALIKADPAGGQTAAIRHVLRALEDGHSFYRPPQSGADRAASPGSTPNAARPALPIAAADVPGRLVINGWAGPYESIPSATRSVRAALDAALAANRCGVILDVAANQGGNMWPMMGGIAPLYDEGELLAFESREGARDSVNVAGGRLRTNDSVFPAVDLPPLASRPHRIALVIGPRTASSGEILVLGFRGQANVRTFGTRTAGATTANRSMQLSNGGMLALTTARLVDRGGKVQRGPLVPDVETAAPLAAAAEWLAKGCEGPD